MTTYIEAALAGTRQYARLKMREAAFRYRATLTCPFYDWDWNSRIGAAIRWLEIAKDWRGLSV